MDLATVALIVTAILGIVGSLAGYKAGKTKVMTKIRQAKEVMDAFTAAVKDDKISKEEVQAIWKEIQELLGLKDEEPTEDA